MMMDSISNKALGGFGGPVVRRAVFFVLISGAPLYRDGV